VRLAVQPRARYRSCGSDGPEVDRLPGAIEVVDGLEGAPESLVPSELSGLDEEAGVVRAHRQPPPSLGWLRAPG
jgi:hypothetical protein